MQHQGFGRKGVAVGSSMAPAGFGAPPRPAALLPQNGVRARPLSPDEIEAAVRKARPASHFHAEESQKSLIVAYLLWYFVGVFGAHRIYLGAWQSGLKQLGCFVGAGVLLGLRMPVVGGILLIFGIIWLFADLFLIPGLRRKLAQQEA